MEEENKSKEHIMEEVDKINKLREQLEKLGQMNFEDYPAGD